jgi:hypothetical protein
MKNKNYTVIKSIKNLEGRTVSIIYSIKEYTREEKREIERSLFIRGRKSVIIWQSKETI